MPQRIGVQAVIDTSQLGSGVSAYLSALNQIISATQNAAKGASFTPAATGLSAVAQNLSGLTGGFAGVSQQVTTLNSHVTGLSQGMDQASGSAIALQAGIGSAIGTAAIQAVQALGEAIRALSADIVEQVGFWERLAISVEFFTAIDLQKDQPMLDVNTALEMTQKEAQGTLLLLQKMSVLSPFTAQQVGQIYRLGQAMGLTKDQADATIQPMLDVGSAAGLNAEVLERVAVAMGQVESRGKLTGEEMRQFANAGIPIKRILVEALDLTNQSFDDALVAGELLSGTVLPEVVKWMHQFDGAAERVSKTTITGLLSSLAEVSQLGVAKFFGKATEQVRGQLLQLVNLLTSPEVFAGLEVIGTDVGKAVSAAIDGIVNSVSYLINTWMQLDPVIKQGIYVFAGGIVTLTLFAGAVGLVSAALGFLINPFTLVVAAMAGFATVWSTNWMGIASTVSSAVDGISTAISVVTDILSDLANNTADVATSILEIFTETLSMAAEWGANIVTSFADGILATVSVVADALMVMGEMMAYLLQPGSPPRLLPDLDTWGTEAANVYLEGWTDADYGILGKITGDMKKILQGALNAGQIEEIDIPTIVMGSGQAISEAINQIRKFGWATQDAINAVIKVTGSAAEQVVGYLTRYTFLADATNKVNAAQAQLNAITKKYDAILGPLQQKLDAITNAQKRSTDSTELQRYQRIVNSQYTTEAAKKMALLKIDEINTQQQIDAAKLEKNFFENNANQQLTLAQEAQKRAEDELKLFQERIGVQTQQYDLAKQIEAIEDRLANKRKATAKAAKKELTPLEKQLKLIKLQQQELSDMVEAYRARRTLADEHATAAQKAAAQMKLQEISLNQQQRDVEALELGYTGVFDKIRQIQIVLADIEKPKKGKSDILGTASDFGGDAKTKIQQALDEYNKAIDDFTTKWEENKKAITATITAINQSLPSFLQLTNAAGTASPLLQTLAKAFGAVVAIMAGNKIVNAVKGLIPIFAALGGAGTLLVASIGLLAAAWTNNWFDIKGVVADAVAYIQGQIQALADSTILGDIIKAFEGFAAQLAATWNSMALYSLDPSIFWENLNKTWDYFVAFFQLTVQGVTQAGQWIANQFITVWLPGFVAWATEVTPKVLSALGAMVQGVIGFLVSFGAKLLDVVYTKLLPNLIAFAVVGAVTITPYLVKFGAVVLAWVANFGTTLANTVLNEWLPGLIGWVQGGGIITALNTFYARILGSIAQISPQIAESFVQLIPPPSVIIDRIKTFVAGIVTGLQQALSGAFGRLSGGDIADGINSFIDNIGAKFTAALLLVTAAANGFKAIFANLGTILGGIGTVVKSGLALFINGNIQVAFGTAKLAATGLLTAFSALFKLLIGAPIGSILGTIASNITAFYNSIKNTNIISAFVSAVAAIAPAIGNFFANLGQLSLKAIQGIIGGIASVFKSGLMAAIGNTLRSVATLITEIFGQGNILAALEQFGLKLMSVFDELGNLSLRVLQNIGNGVRTLATGGFSLLIRSVSSIPKLFVALGNLSLASLKAIGTGLVVLGTKIKSLFTVSNLLAPIKSLMSLLGGLGKMLASGFGSGAGGALSGLVSIFTKGFGSVKTIIMGVGTALRGLLTPANVIGAAIGFIVDQIVKNWSTIAGFINDLGGFFTKLGVLFSPATMGNFGAALQGLFSGTEEGKAKFQAFFDSIWSYLVAWTSQVGDWFMTKVLPAFVGWALNLPGEIGAYIQETFQAMLDLIAMGAGLIRTYVFPWLAAFTSWLVEAWPTISGYLGQVWNDFAAWITETAAILWTKMTTEWIPAFVGWLSAVIPALVTGWLTIEVALWTWIATTAANIWTLMTTQWIPAFTAWLQAVWPPTQTALAAWWGSFSTSVSALASVLWTKFTTEWGPAMWQWIVTSVPPMLAQLGAWITQLLVWIGTQGLPLLIVALLDFATAMVGWIGDAIVWIVPKLGEFIGTILSWIISDGIPALIKGVAGLALVLWGWISGNEKIAANDSAWGKVGEAFKKFIARIGEVITQDVLPAVAKGAQEIVDGFITGINKLFSPENVKSFVDSATKLGADILGGIGAGFQTATGQLNDGFNNAVTGAIDAAKALLGIQSPSTVTRDEIGAPIAQGINEGISSTPLDALAKAIADQIIKALSDVKANTSQTMTDTAAAVLPIAQQFALDLQTLFLTMTTTISNQFWLWSQNIQLLMTEMTAAINNTMINFAVQNMLDWTNIHNTAVAWATAMKDAVILAVTQMVAGVEEQIKTLPGIVWKYVGDQEPGVLYVLNEKFVKKGKGIGKDFVNGICDGISEKVPSLIKEIEDMIARALAAAKTALNSGSPSKVTRDEIGVPFSQGIAVGIANGGAEVAGQVADLVATMVDVEAQDAGASIGNRIVAGIKSSTDAVNLAVSDLLGSALAAKAYNVGKSIGQQIADGIVSSSAAISSAISGTVAGSISAPVNVLAANLVSAPAMSGVGTVNNYNYTRNYNLTLQTGKDSRSVARDFSMMEIMAL